MSSWFWNIYQSVKARAVKLLKCQLQFTPEIPSWSSLILGSYVLPRLWVTHPSGTPILFWLCSGLLTARNLTVEPHPRSCSLASCYFLLQKFSIRSSQAGNFCLFYFSFSITVPLLCSGELQEHLLQEQACGNFYSLLCTGTCMYSMFYALGAQQSWHEMGQINGNQYSFSTVLLERWEMGSNFAAAWLWGRCKSSPLLFRRKPEHPWYQLGAVNPPGERIWRCK